MPSKNASTSWHSGRVKDARGRSVSLLDPVMLHLSRQHGAIPLGPLAKIAEEIGIGMTRTTRVSLWASVFCLVAFAIAVTILLVRLTGGSIGVGKFVRSLAPYGAIWIAPYGLWMGTRSVRLQRTTDVMLQHRRCPHCGYDLQGLQADDDDDGATICPECGSAWRLP
jgi:hypothetical protein